MQALRQDFRKGPGKRFRKGISLTELAAMFPDEATAEAWFEGLRWPDCIACPQCGSTRIACRKDRKPLPYRSP